MSASVTVVLDTRAPALSLDGPEVVGTPDDWSATLTSSEDLVGAVVDLVDAYGVSHPVGGLMISPQEWFFRSDSTEIPGGRVEVRATGYDSVANRAILRSAFQMSRPPSFGVQGDVGRAYSLSREAAGGFTLSADAAGAYGLVAEMRGNDA